VRDVWNELERPAPASVVVDGTEVRSGSRVRLHPADRRDIFSSAVDGRTATVESIEELVGGRILITVSPHDDPGRDLGAARPGHRFFFSPDEIEPLASVLVAGIGNVFLGDDGFGSAVVRRLEDVPLPGGVDVADYGIRGFDLAYALSSGYDGALLIDAAPLGEPPGTLVVLEPGEDDGDATIDTHGMDPLRVLRLADELGGRPPRTLVLACQPAVLADPDAGVDVLVELSEPVQAAVDAAAREVPVLVAQLLEQRPKGGTP
jgi:hydrogenase maturation protease